MNPVHSIRLGLVLLIFVGCNPSQTDPTPPNASQSDSALTANKDLPDREFEFSYGAQLQQLPVGAKVRVWIPIAESNAQQQIEITETQTPGTLQSDRDPDFRNLIGYFEWEVEQAGSAKFEIDYRVVRRQTGIDATEFQLSKQSTQRFLAPTSMVPVTGRPIELLDNVDLPDKSLDVARKIYDLVYEHLSYDKSQPGFGRGDSVWACDSKLGNCTDFHSLFLSLARSQGIPSKFQIGFPIGEAPSGSVSGYHCWAWFHIAGQGWYPVDISEADKHPEQRAFYFGNLSRDRVSFATGRDIQLVPAAKADRLNFLIYPHVEVDGQAWPSDRIELTFGYRDAK